jgi:amino acid transporter
VPANLALPFPGGNAGGDFGSGGSTGRAAILGIFMFTGVETALAVSGSFTALAIVATLACVMVYFIGCAAALRLRATNVAVSGTPVRVSGLPLIAAIGIAIFTVVASLLYRLRCVPAA